MLTKSQSLICWLMSTKVDFRQNWHNSASALWRTKEISGIVFSWTDGTWWTMKEWRHLIMFLYIVHVKLIFIWQRRKHFFTSNLCWWFHCYTKVVDATKFRTSRPIVLYAKSRWKRNYDGRMVTSAQFSISLLFLGSLYSPVTESRFKLTVCVSRLPILGKI